MPTCPACTSLVSGWAQFIFGWGHPESESWREFKQWMSNRQSLPAWTRFITPTTESRRLWDEFHPDDDRDPHERASKEDYRSWLRDFFEDLIKRSSEVDKKFFAGFEQQGGDPLPCLKRFKANAELAQWSDVIRALGHIYRKTAPAQAKYDRKKMGSLSSPF